MYGLPVTGTYTVFVDPYLGGTGSMGLQLLADATGSLTVDGAALPVSLVAGQNGSYTFSGTLGQTLGLGISGLSTTPAGGNVTISVNGPTGSQLINCSSYTSTGGGCNLPALTSTGTYTVRVDPYTTYAAALTLTLSNDVSGTLIANAAATTSSVTRSGQNARYTFSGTVGQNVSLLWTNSTFIGAWSYIHVYRPDGTELTNTYFDNGVNGRASGTLDMYGLPVTGTYTVFVDPYLGGTGSMGLQLK
jgi:hypothetical protein